MWKSHELRATMAMATKVFRLWRYSLKFKTKKKQIT